MAREIIEQAEFGGGGGNGLSSNRENHCRGVDGNLPNRERTRWKRAFKAAQDGFYAGHEFARAKGFRDVVVGSKFEAENAVGFAVFCSQENYRNWGQAWCLADSAAQLETVFAGDHDVEYKERGTLAFRVCDHVRPGGVDA